MANNVLNDIVKQATKLHIDRTTVYDTKGHVKRNGNTNQVGSTLKVIEDILPDIMEALHLQKVTELTEYTREKFPFDIGHSEEYQLLCNVVNEMKCFKTNPLTGKMERIAE